MKSALLRRTVIAVLPLVFSISARADLSSTATLNAGQGLSFDSGATTTTGDILFTGTSITFQGGAKGFNLGNVGAAEYGAINATEAAALAQVASTTPIPLSQLAVGDVFALLTKGGNTAKAMVTASGSTQLAFQFTTYGNTSGGAGGPTITNVTNNYSYIPSGFVNSGISPSTIFTIFGSGLSSPPSGALTLNSSAAPGLPTQDAGATITVTVGTFIAHPAMYYASPAQIAAVLPAGTPTGAGTVTVAYNGAVSNAYQIQIVPSALGLDTYYGTGSGLATATDAVTGSLINFTNSAKPGENIVLWGSGLGADTADSDTVFTNSPHPVNQSGTQAYIGSAAAAVLYAGSSGYPGLNQINITVPNSVTTGCGNSVVVVVNGVPSNFGFLPVNLGGGSCSDAIFGITGTTISSLGGQTTVRSGSTIVGQLVASTGTENIAFADFSSTTGTSYGSATGIVSLGSCSVTEVFSTGGSTTTTTPLDAGTINLAGPAGNYAVPALTKGSYDALLPSTAITSSGGTFVFTGSGGADVGSFTSTVILPNPLLNWTNQNAAATITRSSGLLVTWTGGSSGSWVIIEGSSSNSGGASGSYLCYAPQSAGQFTVPSYVTGTLPAGTGSTIVENGTSFSSFTANGLDHGTGFGFSGVSVNSTYP